MDSQTKAELQQQLCELQSYILKAVLQARQERHPHELASISETTAADVIYAIDTVAESAIERWFSTHWHSAHPVEIVMEGLADGSTLTFPTGTPVADTTLKCIIDPIDGTRGIMYDKRPAWIIAAIAPKEAQTTVFRISRSRQ